MKFLLTMKPEQCSSGNLLWQRQVGNRHGQGGQERIPGQDLRRPERLGLHQDQPSARLQSSLLPRSARSHLDRTSLHQAVAYAATQHQDGGRQRATRTTNNANSNASHSLSTPSTHSPGRHNLDQCQYGATMPDHDGVEQYIRKPARLKIT